MSISQPPHVLFLLPDFFAGGAQRVLISYANGLGSGFRKTILSVRDEGPLKGFVSTDVNCETLKAKKMLFAVPQLLMCLRRVRPDVVVCTMAYVNFLVLLLKPLFPDTIFIVREANMPQVVLKSAGKLQLIYRVLYRILYPLADKVIVPARYIGEQLQHVTGLKGDNHVVLYNPVDVDFIQRAVSMLSDEVPNNVVRYVAAGRLHWQKGFDRLIKALSSYDVSFSWQLDILGDGPDREALQGLIDEGGMENVIFLKGFQDSPWAFYAAADCFLLPSYAEGLPNVVLESLECGTPVIAMREAGGIGEIKEVSADGDVQISASIQEFLENMKEVKKKTAFDVGRSRLPDMFKFSQAITAFENLLLATILQKSKAAD